MVIVQNKINAKTDQEDIVKAIASIKEEIGDDLENVISSKIAELAEQFSTTSYSITEGFKQMQKQIEDLNETITTRMEFNHAQVMNALAAKSINKQNDEEEIKQLDLSI
jgi:hypothetical protein